MENEAPPGAPKSEETSVSQLTCIDLRRTELFHPGRFTSEHHFIMGLVPAPSLTPGTASNSREATAEGLLKPGADWQLQGPVVHYSDASIRLLHS